MRDILFRGKRKDNGKWIEGSLVKKSYTDGCNEFCIQTQVRDTGVGSRIISDISETVGQYTGLNDKNGKMIFEGDIIKIGIDARFIFYGTSGFRHT